MLCQVYVIQNEQGRFFIGVFEDGLKRLEDYNSGVSKWTRDRGPWKPVWHPKDFQKCFDVFHQAIANLMGFWLERSVEAQSSPGTTKTNSHWWDGTPSSLNIQNIGPAGAKISFSADV